MLTPVRPQVLTHAWDHRYGDDSNDPSRGFSVGPAVGTLSPSDSHTPSSSVPSLYFLPAIHYVHAFEVQNDNYDEADHQHENEDENEIFTSQGPNGSTDMAYSYMGIDIDRGDSNHSGIESNHEEGDGNSLEDGSRSQSSNNNVNTYNSDNSSNTNVSRGRVGSPYRGRERGSDSNSGSNRRHFPSSGCSDLASCVVQLPVAEPLQDPVPGPAQDPPEKTIQEALASLPPMTSTLDPTLLPVLLTPSISTSALEETNLQSPVLPSSTLQLASSTSNHQSSAAQALSPPPSLTTSPVLPLVIPHTPATSTTTLSSSLSPIDSIVTDSGMPSPRFLLSSPPSSPPRIAAVHDHLHRNPNEVDFEVERSIDLPRGLEQYGMIRPRTSSSRPSTTPRMTSMWAFFGVVFLITSIIALYDTTFIIRISNGFYNGGFRTNSNNFGDENNLSSNENVDNRAIGINPLLMEMDQFINLISGNGVEDSAFSPIPVSPFFIHNELRSMEGSTSDGSEIEQVLSVHRNNEIDSLVIDNFLLDVDDDHQNYDDIDHDIAASGNNVLDGESIEEHSLRMFHETLLRMSEEVEIARVIDTGGNMNVNMNIDVHIGNLDSATTVMTNGPRDRDEEVESGEREIDIEGEGLLTQRSNGNSNRHIWNSARRSLAQLLTTFIHLHDYDSASGGTILYPEGAGEHSMVTSEKI